MTTTNAVHPYSRARRPAADLDEVDDRSTFARCPAFQATTPATAMTAQHPEIRPEQSIELLKQLHILTRDGKLNQDSRRKLKQVYHLYQFIEPLLSAALAERADIQLVDHGAGKSYLGATARTHRCRHRAARLQHRHR